MYVPSGGAFAPAEAADASINRAEAIAKARQAAATISRMVATDEAAAVQRRGAASSSPAISGGGVGVREHLRRFKDFEAQVEAAAREMIEHTPSRRAERSRTKQQLPFLTAQEGIRKAQSAEATAPRAEAGTTLDRSMTKHLRCYVSLCSGAADAISTKLAGPGMPPSLASLVSAYLDVLEKHRRIAAAAARELEGMERLGAR